MDVLADFVADIAQKRSIDKVLDDGMLVAVGCQKRLTANATVLAYGCD